MLTLNDDIRQELSAISRATLACRIAKWRSPKPKQKTFNGSKFDQAKTPFDRLMEKGVIPADKKEALLQKSKPLIRQRFPLSFLALFIVILLMVLYQEKIKKQPLQLTK
ncbi:hypothetical protein J2S00_002730 [Caldalkalibacillus uzonensis]|uniref:Uncharacterized protein n=2 Tax=Caldalkalibacillus uzonensis TaxID=353224 RepID=A0ABU0CU85_9BACI|nr:hypothetical protein [Caldalkalibacillus uzonensis]